MNGLPILLCVLDRVLNQRLSVMLNQQGFDVFKLKENNDVIHFFDEGKRALLILGSPDPRSPELLTLAKEVRALDRRVPIIFISSCKTNEDTVAALRVGIKDYFCNPFEDTDLIDSIRRCTFQCQSRLTISRSFKKPAHDNGMIGESSVFQKMRTLLSKFSKSHCHVLITGETGTGKELAAKFIHDQSARCNKPFVSINCAAIPEALLESELFGFERGAFTGAQSSYEGRMRLANGGTVFLDEIGEMSHLAQAKLLRVLEAKEVFPLGGKRNIPLDVKIIAATNCDIEKAVSENRFRQDLFFRLNVARAHLPALRERKEDIPLLVNHYIAQFKNNQDHCAETINENTLRLLVAHPWPGNIRELRNVLEGVFIDPPDGEVRAEHLPCHFQTCSVANKADNQSERDKLLTTLRDMNGNKSKAARSLRWSRMTLYRKMAKYNIDDEFNSEANGQTNNFGPEILH